MIMCKGFTMTAKEAAEKTSTVRIKIITRFIKEIAEDIHSCALRGRTSSSIFYLPDLPEVLQHFQKLGFDIEDATHNHHVRFTWGGK